mgnify:CR=1 FL=1
MYTTKKILTIIKKGPAFTRQDTADWWEMVDWKEVQEYRGLLRKTEYEAMMNKLLASARQERLQDLKQIRALRETNKRIKQGASSLAEIYGKEV